MVERERGIVMVDINQAAMLEVLGRVMREAGIPNDQLLFVQDATIARNVIEDLHNPPALILLYVGVDKDGEEALDLIRWLRREESPCKDSPIIAVSADAREGTKQAVIGLGANEFIDAPFEIGDVIRKAKSHLGMEGAK